MHPSTRGVVVDFAELSDAGRDPSKQINEDASAYAETEHGHLAVVCDGMGGHAAGRAASETAVRTIVEAMTAESSETSPATALKSAIEAAGRAVYALGGDAPGHLRPGSTCVAALVHDQGAEIAHVGDSRAYLVRSGSIQRLTRDHSMVQQMVEAGMLDAQHAAQHPDANKLTRALGMVPEVEVELGPGPLSLQQGDVILLASDGLSDLVADDELLAVIARTIASGPALSCQELVALANARGGHDNLTAQLLFIAQAPVFQQAAGPTLLDPQGARRLSPGGTLIDARSRAQPTVSDARARAKTAPTLLDDAAPARTTLPDVPGAPATSERRMFSRASAPPDGAPARGGRMFAFAIAICAFSVIAVLLFWLFGPARRARRVDAPPPPPATAPAPPPLVELEAAVPSASASAETPDARP